MIDYLLFDSIGWRLPITEPMIGAIFSMDRLRMKAFSPSVALDGRFG